MKNIYSLLLATIMLLSAKAQIVSTSSGGNWNSTTTWVSGVVPGITDDVIIADGATVIIDVDAQALSLTVGQGTSGILEFESVTARTMTVATNTIVAAGGTFRSPSSGTQTDHLLVAGGSLTNNGTFDFSTNANSAAAGISFTGTPDAVFDGTGSVTDVFAISIDKGTDTTSILDLNPSAFTFMGSSTLAINEPSFLDIINGTFKISGAFTMDNGLFSGSGTITILPTAGLWMNNPNFTVVPRSATLNVEGKLQVDAGILNIGTADGNRLGYVDGSVITINGGTVNVASRMSPSAGFGIIYTQTGGVINLNTAGNSSFARASFDIADDNSFFTMSGGTISLQNASTGIGDYSNFATNFNITGGTLQVGNAASGVAQTYFLSGTAPNLVIDNTIAGHTVKLFDNLTVTLNTTINPTTTLTLDNGTDGLIYTQLGSSFINSGTLNGTVADSRLSFAGTVAQTYSGDGILTSPLSGFEMNNPAGLTIANTIASDFTVDQLIMTAGDIITGVSTLTLGTSELSVGSQVYTSGTIVGKFKRWISTTTGNRNFRVGIAGSTRNAAIDYTTAPTTGGTLTAEWISVPGGNNGLPLTEGAITVTFTSSNGYWSLIAGDGLSGGIYDGTFTATNITDIIDFSQLVLLKRADNTSPWTLDGTYVPTTGSNTEAILSRTGMSGFSDFGIGGNSSSLPVAIEFFKGSKQSNGNLLDWKISCTNSTGANMVIERSNDGRKFSGIYNLHADVLRCMQPFNYTDNNPSAGVNYYRLKITDADGRPAYSKVLALLNKEDGFDIVSILPNPVDRTAVLSIASATASKMEIVITDITGKKVSRQKVNLIAGSNQFPIDLQNLAKGNYQVTGYAAGAQPKTLQFIKN